MGEELQVQAQPPATGATELIKKRSIDFAYLRKNFRKWRKKYDLFIMKLELREQLKKLRTSE